MPGLKISLLQQPLVWMDGPANLRHFDRQLEGITGRDVIVLPEMFTTGFAMEAAKQSLPEADVVEWMHARAAQSQALIAGSAALQTEHGAVNRFLLVEPDGTVHHYDKRHLFRMADEHHHYEAGNQRVVFEWRGWRILPLVCYDLRFPVWSRNQNDYDLALYVANWPAPRSLHWQSLLIARAIENQAYVANWPAPRSLHWQSLLIARAIENQAYVAGCNRVGTDGNGHHYRGDSRIINPQGEIIATADPHQATRLDAELSLSALQEYREKFPAWRDADPFTIG
ncbi:amidohydrolase [Klebsiella pneumoniae]|nr:amidohydrolase [Klebsiella pneumoniae]HBS6497347.1 amidohydrolase [Klebsiella pneumoniae]HCB0255792.1 amidohydrolase [Klebsiella pneumoniae]HDT7218706.1 amidohydrolase [Klebsiella pneumoniae]HDY9081373.1 amidohydrolase [Klebsiella pneumoniae]